MKGTKSMTSHFSTPLEKGRFRPRQWWKKSSLLLRRTKSLKAETSHNWTKFGNLGQSEYRCTEQHQSISNWVVHHKKENFGMRLDRGNKICNSAEIRVWISRNIFRLFWNFKLPGFWCKEQNQHVFTAILLYKFKPFQWNLEGRDRTCSNWGIQFWISREMNTKIFLGTIGLSSKDQNEGFPNRLIFQNCPFVERDLDRRPKTSIFAKKS